MGKKPNGYWKNFDNIEAVLRPIIDELGRMPTAGELFERKLSAVINSIVAYHDGFPAVAEQLNVAVSFREKNAEIWQGNFENLREALCPLIAELGRMPTTKDLSKRKLSRLTKAMTFHGGPYAVAVRLGLSKEMCRDMRGYWQNEGNIETELAPIVTELGRMPTAQELMDRGLQALMASIYRGEGGLPAVRSRLGAAAKDPPDRTGPLKDFTNLESALQPVILEIGRMPTKEELAERNLHAIGRAIWCHHDGFAAVERRLGLDGTGRRKEKGYWQDLSTVRAAILPLATRLGRMPYEEELREENLSAVVDAISRLHGGFPAAAASLGLTYVYRRMPSRYWQEFVHVEIALAPVIAELGRIPSKSELIARGLSGVETGIQEYHGGIQAVRIRLGLPEGARKPLGYWNDFENLRQSLLPLIVEIGRMPTNNDLYKRRLSSLRDAIVRHGGMSVVAERLGLGPVTDEVLASRANEIARVILALNLINTELFWSAVKRRWTFRDFNEALDDYTMNGILDRFRGLLAG